MEQKTHKALLEQLIPLLSTIDFDEQFDKLTKDESNHSRFLLKMEINRLATPCRRYIDLRNRINNECFPYEFQGLRHFMDEVGITIFESQLKIYGGAYTIGVYEAVLDPEQRKSLSQQKEGEDGSTLTPTSTPSSVFRYFDVTSVVFASYHGRKEERIHYRSPLMLRLSDGERLYAKSSDLSSSGLRVEVPYVPPFQMGETIEVFFTGLEREQRNPLLHRGIPFKFIGSQNKDDRHWLRLLRNSDDVEFEQFIEQFIDDNKRKYRVSVDYMLSAAMIKGHEQFYIPRMTGLPLFFDQQEIPEHRYLLRTENNFKPLEYWRNEKNEQMLGGVFHSERMKSLLAQAQPLKQTLIYSFTHTLKSHLYFYVATAEELHESGLKELFFQIGAKRPSWRVHQLFLEQLSPNEAFKLNHFLLEEKELQGLQHLLEKKIAQLGWVGLMQDITDEMHRDDYLQHAPIELDANQLQRFGLHSEVKEFDIQIFNYVQLRKENRYLHKTLVQLKVDEVIYDGWTRDISSQGLQLEFDEQIHCNKGDTLHFSFPKLQALTQNMKLTDLPYSVVGTNPSRTILHLCIEGHLKNHVGYHFFHKLIQSNEEKLPQNTQPRDEGLPSALRNIYTHHLFTYPFFLKKSKSRLRLGALGIAPTERCLGELFQICAYKERYNLYPLLHGQLLQEQLLLPLKAMHTESPPKEVELYISYQLSWGNALPKFVTRTEHEFISSDEKREFIEQALQQGGFFSVRMIISRAGRPDIHFLSSELEYITQFAIHKAKQLEDELWCITGVVDLIDTTEATLFRFGVVLDPPDKK